MRQARWLPTLLVAAAVVAAAALPSLWLGVVAALALPLLLLLQQPAPLPYRPPPPAPPADAAAPAQLQGVLAGIGEGVLGVDRQLRVLFANPAAQLLLELPPLPPLPPALDELLPWPLLQRAVANCVANAEPAAFETTWGGEGRPRTLAVQVTPLWQQAEVQGAVVVIADRSQLRRLESHRRDFIANVSHELKTPLAAILGLVETLVDDPQLDAARRQDFLARIQRQADRLNRLVADLLTLSHLDEERGQLEPVEPTDLVLVVQEVLRDLRPLAEKRGLALEVEAPPPPLRVAAEPEAMHQVVSNLVDNAIKYTPAGGRVRVRLEHKDGRIGFEVEDTGVGLTPADQERVFERFYRVDKARSREVGGTGLGLSIVKNTVANCGGAVGVRSTLGRGSTFWVTLPPAPAPAATGEP